MQALVLDVQKKTVLERKYVLNGSWANLCLLNHNKILCNWIWKLDSLCYFLEEMDTYMNIKFTSKLNNED